MSWLRRILPSVGTFSRAQTAQSDLAAENLWQNCSKCQHALYVPELEEQFFVCHNCNKHLRISARQRLHQFCDSDSEIKDLANHIKAVDWLNFKDREKYRSRIAIAEKKTDETEALLVVEGRLEGQLMVVMAFEFSFLGGSMSSAVGERFILGINYAVEHGLPVVCFSTSGGARMQESMYSLLQMSRTAAAIEKLKRAGLAYISVLIDPVYGGVCASLAMLGDLNIAEPDALVGFTGPRVMEQTLRVKLPEGFQRSEFLLEHGAIDMIVERANLRSTIARSLRRFSSSS